MRLSGSGCGSCRLRGSGCGSGRLRGSVFLEIRKIGVEADVCRSIVSGKLGKLVVDLDDVFNSQNNQHDQLVSDADGDRSENHCEQALEKGRAIHIGTEIEYSQEAVENGKGGREDVEGFEDFFDDEAAEITYIDKEFNKGILT